MFGADKTTEYISACGRKFYASYLPTGIIVSVDLDEDNAIGVFIVPWYFPEECLKNLIEEWDTTVYSQIDWSKVRSELDLDEEVD